MTKIGNPTAPSVFFWLSLVVLVAGATMGPFSFHASFFWSVILPIMVIVQLAIGVAIAAHTRGVWFLFAILLTGAMGFSGCHVAANIFEWEMKARAIRAAATGALEFNIWPYKFEYAGSGVFTAPNSWYGVEVSPKNGILTARLTE